jgi:deoxyribodipyrimidine photo-lyase
MESCLVWFQLDLRLRDQPALAAALAAGHIPVPCYCLDDALEDGWRPGGASRWWLGQSLQRLDAALAERGSRLVLRQGDTVEVLMALAEETGARHIYFNRRYEPWIKSLENRLKLAAAERGIQLHRYQCGLLFNPDEIATQSGKPYQVFTPYWRSCLSLPERAQGREAPAQLPALAAWPESIAPDAMAHMPRLPWVHGLASSWQPGENGGQLQLQRFIEHALADYAEGRDCPSQPLTSLLSPYLHFGELSIRQIWHAVDVDAPAHADSVSTSVQKYRAELGWREFAHHVMVHFPQTSDSPLREGFAAFPWVDNPEHLQRWQQGQTGYPWVDAGMRQLWQTGWMHNRVRMAAASFLVKHLRIHWLQGARWFWDTLVDADLPSNTLGWQWSAGCGADAAPYFRIFNPVLQGQKFDAEGEYVKRWLPELARLPAQYVHQPWQAPQNVLREAGITLGHDYPYPVVDHATAREQALVALERCRDNIAG